MSEGMETMLRRSLDAVDQRRRRLTWLLIIAALGIAWEFFRLTQIASAGDVPQMIVQAVIALFFSILGVGVLLVFQLTVATRRILRVIELLSPPSASSR